MEPEKYRVPVAFWLSLDAVYYKSKLLWAL